MNDKQREAAAAAYADLVEGDDFEISPQVSPTDPAEIDDFLADLIPPADREAARGRGRPSLSGKGTSPTRQVRLPEELDAALRARAKAEGRRPSDVMRTAVTQYLAS